MKLKKFYLFFQILIILKCLIRVVYSYDINLTNDPTVMDNLAEVYKDTVNSMKYDEIRIVFNEKKYDIAPYGRNHFNIDKTLIFYSNKGSTLDFGDTNLSTLRFHFLPGTENQKLLFKNLTFINYRGLTEIYDHLLTFSVNDDKNNFSVEFENCTFIDIDGYLLNIEVTYKQPVKEDPQLLFKNCSFK